MVLSNYGLTLDKLEQIPCVRKLTLWRHDRAAIADVATYELVHERDNVERRHVLGDDAKRGGVGGGKHVWLVVVSGAMDGRTPEPRSAA